MQQLVAQAQRQLPDDVFRCFTACQQFECPFHFHLATALGGIAQGADDRHGVTGLQPAKKLMHPVTDDAFGLNHCRLAGFDAALDDLGQIIDGVEKDIVQLANLLFHIAWYGEVHDEDRAVSAGLDGTLNHAQSDDGQGAGRAGNDDVVFRQVFRQLIESNGVAAEAVRQLQSAFDCAVGDGDLTRLLGAEMCGA